MVWGWPSRHMTNSSLVYPGLVSRLRASGEPLRYREVSADEVLRYFTTPPVWENCSQTVHEIHDHICDNRQGNRRAGRCASAKQVFFEKCKSRLKCKSVQKVVETKV